MNKSTSILVVLFFFWIHHSAIAQYRRTYRGFSGQSPIEFGIGIGPTAYQGDLSIGIITWEKTKLNIGGFVRIKPFDRMAFRAGINYGRIAGDDAEWGKYYSKSDNAYGLGSTRQMAYYERYKRNLNFWSNIFEVNVMTEINLYHPRTRRRIGAPLPYMVLGIGYFHFNPRTTDRNGGSVKLRYVPTEQYKSYSLWQVCFPAGLGLKFYSDKNWYITLEVVYRKTFTDWIDDVHHSYGGPGIKNNVAAQQLSDRSGEISPDWGKNWDKVTADPNYNLRGNPKNNDSYIFCMLTINRSFSSYSTCTNF
ncbi:MAG: hypothetical protein HYZ42_09380 [Bacteroidetes bacterium]|nr:hypothetical protein [Bacteroidota bacterium]